MLTKKQLSTLPLGKDCRLQTCELDELSVFAALEAFGTKFQLVYFQSSYLLEMRPHKIQPANFHAILKCNTCSRIS